MYTITLDHGLNEETYPGLMKAIKKFVADALFNDEPQSHYGFEFHVPKPVKVTPRPTRSSFEVAAPPTGVIQLVGSACANSPESGFSEKLALINGEIVGSEGWAFELEDEDEGWDARYEDTRRWYEENNLTYPGEWTIR